MRVLGSTRKNNSGRVPSVAGGSSAAVRPYDLKDPWTTEGEITRPPKADHHQESRRDVLGIEQDKLIPVSPTASQRGLVLRIV